MNGSLGRKLGGHWSNFPLKPEVWKWADGQADTDSAFSGVVNSRQVM